MGSLCGTSNIYDRPHHSRHAVRQVPVPVTHRPERERVDIEEKFKDFEEFNNGKTIGEGIKQIPAYKCSINDTELNKLREDFWASRRGNRLIWDCLSTICKADAATAYELIKAAELKCVGNNLRCVIDPRNPNQIFRIPNFCIEDPIYEKDFSALQQKANDITEKSIKIILENFLKMEKTELIVSNKMIANNVKKLYAERLNLSLSKFKIRFLYRGKEIMNHHSLSLYNLDSNSKIQVSINEI